jgi:surfeit locus 1 family protein
MHFRKPQLVPLLFMLCAVALCLTLGTWQLQRLAWKNALFGDIAQAQAEPALGTLPDDPLALSHLAWRKAVLTGKFLPDKELRFIGRQSNGYVHLVPLKLDDSDLVLLVDTGWLPGDLPAKVAPGMQTVQGVLRPPHAKRLFSPGNAPGRNLWFTEDMPALEQATGLKLVPYVLQSGDLPKLHNDHLGYAITWYALALVGVGMFAAYQRKRA